MAIIAPSFIPKYNPTADAWGGISDIFGDLTRMRESKRQIERQRIADAQSAASHASLQRNRDQLHAQRAAQMTEYDAQLAREEAERKNRLTVEQQAEHWGTITGPTLPSNWEQRWRTKVGSSKADKDMAMAQLARRSQRDTILNLNTLNNAKIATQQEYRAGRIDDATYTLRMNQIAKAEEDTKTAAIKARIAEEGEAGQIQRNQSLVTQAEETAKWQKIRAENALRKQQADINRAGDLSGVENILRGRGELPVQTQVGPESFQTSQQPITPGSGLYNQAILDWSILGNPSANQLKAVRQHAGLADAASGRTAIPDTMSKKQHQDSLAATMLEEIKVRPDYHEKAFDEDEVNRARDNILRAAKQIAIASGDSSLDNQWKIAYILSKNFNSGFKKGDKVAPWLSKNYQDYTPMSTDDIVTAYKKGTPQGNQNNVAVPPEVTARYNQLKAAGKGRSEIERILRSEGLIE